MSTLGIRKAERGVRAATGARDKAIRLAGIESEAVMEQSFKCPIPTESFAMFWGRVEDKPKELGLMASVLLKKVVELLSATTTTDSKGVAESKEEKQLPAELLASVSTVSLLALYFPCASVGNTKMLLGQLEPYYEDEVNLTRRLPTIKEPMRLIRGSIEGVDLLGAALIGASTLHTLAEFSSLNSITDFPTVDPTAPVTIEGSLWYEWLRDTSLESEAKRLSVLTGLTNKMLTLPQQMKMNTLIAFTTGLSLFHMFHNIFAMRPVTDMAFLNRAFSIINQFYLWPLPMGALARDTMQLIQREMVWPGAAMLNVLEQESRVGQQDAAVGGVRSKCLYYFFDPAFENARLLFKEVMRTSNPLDKEVRAKTGPWKRRPSHQLKNRPDEVVKTTRLPNVSKALVMMNMLANECALTEAEAKTISEVNPATIDAEYEKLSAARKDLESSQQPVAALTESRKQLLAALKKTLLAAKPGGQVADFPLVAPYTCFLPLVEHIAIETDVQFEPTPPTPKENAQLLCLAYIPFPQPPEYYDHLEYILHQHAMEPKPCEARVMVCGGEKALHGMLCAYLHLCQLAPPSFTGIYFKFYVLPFGENSMAQYLARVDSWYRRHVYKPCMAKTLVMPWLLPGGDSKKEDEYGITIVGRFLRETFSTYAREARNVMNVHVWLVKGWCEYEQKQEATEPKGGKVDKLAAQPDFSIPFMSYCEIGIQAQAEEFRKKKKLKSTVEEIIAVSSEKSGFVFNPPEIGVEFIPSDLRGHSLNTVEEDPEKYRSIILRNVPKAGEKAFPANPQSGSLELGAVFATAKAAAAYSKNLLATEPFQRVNEARMSCTAPRATFHVVCDGESFGPFHHIVIEPARHPLNNSPTYGGLPVAPGDVVTFPVQCFFPIVN